MKPTTPLWIILAAGLVGPVLAEEPLKMDSDTARINYSLGYQIGGDFKRQGIEMDPRAVVKGIEDALSGAEPLMDTQAMQITLMALKQKIIADQQAKAAEAKRQKIVAGEQFLEENAKQPGVVTTESGLQYQIIEPGTGSNPGPSDQVTVNYRGTLIDGTEFDSSYSRGRPATFPLSGVIEGWTEGLQLVKEGSKIKLFVPQQLAYGDQGPLAQQTLIFDVELLSIGDQSKAPAPAEGEPSAGQ